MTQLEMRDVDAIIARNRKVKESNQIDWEQRRYEIAKDILCAAYCDCLPSKAVKDAVEYADALIKELKGEE